MKLLNGTKEPRSRNSEGCTVLDCGCAHTPTTWLQMCDAHYAEDHTLHEQARLDHLASELT